MRSLYMGQSPPSMSRSIAAAFFRGSSPNSSCRPGTSPNARCRQDTDHSKTKRLCALRLHLRPDCYASVNILGVKGPPTVPHHIVAFRSTHLNSSRPCGSIPCKSTKTLPGARTATLYYACGLPVTASIVKTFTLLRLLTRFQSRTSRAPANFEAARPACGGDC